MKIGILALQGNFERHCQAVERVQQVPVLVKKAPHLTDVSGLILPGGESTTNIKLLKQSDLMPAIFDFFKQGKPLFGTCAGLILLAKNIENSSQFSFEFLDVTVARNAYGSQRESFSHGVAIPSIGMQEFPCVFIRAPKIVQIQDNNVNVLAKFQDSPILVRQNNILGATFHPEMTDDSRIHDIFVKMCENFSPKK